MSKFFRDGFLSIWFLKVKIGWSNSEMLWGWQSLPFDSWCPKWLEHVVQGLNRWGVTWGCVTYLSSKTLPRYLVLSPKKCRDIWCSRHFCPFFFENCQNFPKQCLRQRKLRNLSNLVKALWAGHLTYSSPDVVYGEKFACETPYKTLILLFYGFYQLILPESCIS